MDAVRHMERLNTVRDFIYKAFRQGKEFRYAKVVAKTGATVDEARVAVGFFTAKRLIPESYFSSIRPVSQQKPSIKRGTKARVRKVPKKGRPPFLPQAPIPHRPYKSRSAFVRALLLRKLKASTEKPITLQSTVNYTAYKPALVRRVARELIAEGLASKGMFAEFRKKRKKRKTKKK